MTVPDTGASREALANLLVRVEGATNGDRELDREIARNFGWHNVDTDPFGSGCGAADMVGMPPDTAIFARIDPFTASVDAALGLAERMLPGWTIANINQDDTKRWSTELREGYQTSFNRVVISGPLPTPAIALCVSILQAKIAETES